MKLHGKNIIGNRSSAAGQRKIAAFDPRNQKSLSPIFIQATPEELSESLDIAERAFPEYRRRSWHDIAAFFNDIVHEIRAIDKELIDRLDMETALGKERLTAELNRTLSQIKMFAREILDGSWLEARIDLPDKNRKPFPKPDIRQMRIPIGPVAVFAASNFPLAFSVAGGDTISALASKNPVIVKAHPAHPGGSEMVARGIQAAIRKSGMPPGIFSMLHGIDHDIGKKLVNDTRIHSAAFTGSREGGRALYDIASRRASPIPVYAEMGSINPVFVLPDAYRDSESIAAALAQSICLGAGQFCTNPGTIFLIKNRDSQYFLNVLSGSLHGKTLGPMIYPEILEAYISGLNSILNISGVHLHRKISLQGHDNTAMGHLLVTDGHSFINNPGLSQEVFGPSSIAVLCESEEEMIEIALNLEGQLTATIYAAHTHQKVFRQLISILEQKAGRLLFNEVPTGVEVCPSIHHGGPYPASTLSGATSVGTLALRRFTRPVCYQNYPDECLPVELKNVNERGIWRLINNEFTRSDCLKR